MSDNQNIVIDWTKLMSDILVTCLKLLMSDIFDYLIEIDLGLSDV